MPSQEPAAAPMRGGQPSGTGQGDRQPSVSDVLASCQAANAVSTPPDRSDSETAGETAWGDARENEGDGPEEIRPDAA